MSQYQTILRVQTSIPHETISGATQYTNLDLYSAIPIKINKSFAELQDIGSKNSDYSIGLALPGTKKNNRFFESFFNVDSQSLYFNATQKVLCNVLIDNSAYFTGYMRLNKVSVLNSKVEYDVTLFSTIGNLFGDIGNNLLKDLNFDDPDYTFNHTFDYYTSIVDPFENQSSNFGRKNEKPFMYYYPIVHNGYEYTGSTVNVSGGTAEQQTRLYTSTLPIGSFPSVTGLTGYKPFRINSYGADQGLIDNQLKPALSIWGLIKLIFKTYGYSITSDFMNTPWMKTLYMYGYYGSEKTKFSYKIDTIQSLPLEGVELIYSGSTVPGTPLSIIVCKRGTGIPCYSTQDVPYAFANMFPYTERGTIPANTSGLTITAVEGFDFGFESGGVPVADISTLKYTPKAVGDSVSFVDGDFVNFNLVVDENIKQIDLLSSIAKKFNLVFIPDPDNPKNIIIESYPYYVGTGNIYDWTPKLSYDKGFTVEPALNFVESNIIWTDQEDGDYGNKQFKDRNKQIYGQKNFYGPTNFKSQEKRIDTIFSPQIMRQWDTADQLGANVSQGIKLPLGINYVGSSSTREVGNTTETFFAYKGLKSKPKLFFFLGGANIFLDTLGEAYATSGQTTYKISILNSNKTVGRATRTIPIISHTMPMGMSDSKKINNDSACILFNSEQPVDVGVQTYKTYTDNDAYALFYSNRIDNIYNINTRFIKGYFDLKLSDIANLKTNDVIKIQEQFFIVNQINGFNLTNRELTEVELLQYNLNPQSYPTRYFKYQYCDQLGYYFKIKTDFTEPRLIDTQFGWSVFYDQCIGTFTGATTPTGFTACLKDPNATGNTYVPFTISEITQNEYETGGYYDISQDTMVQEIWNFINIPFPSVEYAFGLGLPSFWINAAGTYEGLNLWANCASFNTTKTTYGITTESSTTYGAIVTPTPTPTSSPTPTPSGPTPTPTPTPLYPTPVVNEGRYWAAGYWNSSASPNGARIYNSNDTGFTFTQTVNTGAAINGSSYLSETGQYQIVSGTRTYVSQNYGVSFTDVNIFGQQNNANGCYISKTGKYMSVVDINGDIQFSSDSGTTFTTLSSSVYTINCACISQTGYPQYYGLIPGKLLYIPTSGATLTPLTTSPNLAWTSIDTSINGQYITGTENNGYIYTSSNSGSTWNIYTGLTIINNFGSGGYCSSVIRMSQSGQIQVLACYNGVFISYNYGLTWTQVTSLTGTYDSATISTSGQVIGVKNFGGNTIKISRDYGFTWTNSGPSLLLTALATNR